MNKNTEWIDCGAGILTHPNEQLSNRVIKTRVVELKGFGRIFEVYDYSNEPEQNFQLILAAPTILTLLERMNENMGHAESCARRFHGSNECTCIKADIGAAIEAATFKPYKP